MENEKWEVPKKVSTVHFQLSTYSLVREPQLLNDLGHIFFAEVQVFGFEGNGTNDRVAAAAVTFADLGYVVKPRARRPWIRADRDLRAL
jgi:hypothetical protein